MNSMYRINTEMMIMFFDLFLLSIYWETLKQRSIIELPTRGKKKKKNNNNKANKRGAPKGVCSNRTQGPMRSAAPWY